MSVLLKRKLLGLWKSRTHMASLLLSVLVGSTFQIQEWLKYKLDAADYALAGAVLYAAINVLRWITTLPLEEKAKR